MNILLKIKTGRHRASAAVRPLTAGLLSVLLSLQAAAPYNAFAETADVYFEAEDAQGAAGAESSDEFIPGSGEIFLEDPAAGEIIIDDANTEPASSSDEDVSALNSDDSVAADEGIDIGTAAAVTKEEEAAARERLAAIEKEEAEKRAAREATLLGRLRIQLLSDGNELSPDAAVHYICDNGADYVAADDGGIIYIYEPCITRGGEYFLTQDTLNEAIKQHVTDLITDENLSSTGEFWNHIMLRDPPQRSGDNGQSRPVDANGVMIVPYFNQGHGYLVNGTWLYTDWPSATFNVNGHTMSQAGCGFFSTAMALSYVTQRIIAPVDFKENGQYIADNGSAVTVGVMSASLYNVPAYTTNDINVVLDALRSGKPVMEHVGAPPFTNNGHYILLVGVLPDGTIAVNDPGHVENTYWYCGVSFPIETILGCVKDPGTAFTVFG